MFKDIFNIPSEQLIFESFGKTYNKSSDEPDYDKLFKVLAQKFKHERNIQAPKQTHTSR